MSAHHDEHALPGDQPDPAFGPAAFWLAWGATVVVISVLVIQYFVYASVAKQQNAKSQGYAELRAVRAEHQAQLAGPGGTSIDAAMEQVVRENRR